MGISNFQIPRVYPITDARISGISHVEQVRRLIAGGATLIQLREKHASPREFLDAALNAVAVARENNVKIIINDRVDIALVAEADGVHLGQDDMPPEWAREVLGSNAIIGFSTHSVEQAQRASEMPIDYLAIGPVFQTSTKADPDPVIGLEGVSAVRASVGSLPLVAIGGITASSALSVVAAGSDSVAMISSVIGQPDAITETMNGLLRQLKLQTLFGEVKN